MNSKTRTRTVKILAMMVIYILPYIIFTSFGSYIQFFRWPNYGYNESVPAGKIWCPYGFGSRYIFINDESTYKFDNYISYFYLPLILIDRSIIHKNVNYSKEEFEAIIKTKKIQLNLKHQTAASEHHPELKSTPTPAPTKSEFKP